MRLHLRPGNRGKGGEKKMKTQKIEEHFLSVEKEQMALYKKGQIEGSEVGRYVWGDYENLPNIALAETRVYRERLLHVFSKDSLVTNRVIKTVALVHSKTGSTYFGFRSSSIVIDDDLHVWRVVEEVEGKKILYRQKFAPFWDEPRRACRPLSDLIKKPSKKIDNFIQNCQFDG
jgi:hypothetical protein